VLLEVIKTRNVSLVGGSEISPALLDVAKSSVSREQGGMLEILSKQLCRRFCPGLFAAPQAAIVLLTRLPEQ
jgi:hypothetical protein